MAWHIAGMNLQNDVVSYSKSKLKGLVAVARSKKSQGNSKLQTRWQCFSVIGILFANSGCNPRQKFIKSLRIHSHEIGKCCCIFCMKFARQVFILNQYNRNNKIIETTSDLAKFFNNFQYAGEYATVRGRVRNCTLASTQLCASEYAAIRQISAY